MRNPKSKIIQLCLFVLTVALSMSSCSRKTIYSHYEHTPIDGWGWGQSDTLYFSVAPVREGGVFAEQIGIRMNTAYPFMGLSLVVRQKTKLSGVSRKDTVTVKVTDEDGNYLGRGFSLYEHLQPLPDIKLEDDDSLSICVWHFMRRENLRGISDVGITLTRR